MRRRWLAPSAALLALCGCAQVLGIEEGTDSPWFCNAHVAVPSGKTSYDFHFVDGELMPLTPAPVNLCAQSDPTCAKPKPKTMKADGTLQLRLDASNDGYLDLPVPVGWSTIVELGPPGNVVPTDRTFPVLSTIDVNYFKLTLGLMQDGSNGAVIVAAYDCNEMPAVGVEIAITIEGRPVQTTPVYLASDYKTIVSGGSTSMAGLGLLTNVSPSDAATVTLTRASDKAVVATALVHVRATTVTEIYLGPTKTE